MYNPDTREIALASDEIEKAQLEKEGFLAAPETFHERIATILGNKSRARLKESSVLMRDLRAAAASAKPKNRGKRRS